MLLFKEFMELVNPAPVVNMFTGGAGRIGYGGLFRVGRWVAAPEGVGILVSITADTARVALVNIDGTTAGVLVTPHGLLREAKAQEIPSSRCSYDRAVACGYAP